jgi:hypothetical protein
VKTIVRIGVSERLTNISPFLLLGPLLSHQVIDVLLKLRQSVQHKILKLFVIGNLELIALLFSRLSVRRSSQAIILGLVITTTLEGFIERFENLFVFSSDIVFSCEAVIFSGGSGSLIL